MRLDGAVAALRARPARTALLFDFDGTLSPTVTDPAAADPAPGVGVLLDALGGRYGLVAIISGRPVSFLDPHLPPGIVISGQYGAELRDRDGEHRVMADTRWLDVVASVVADLASRTGGSRVPDGVVVEPKGLTLTIHHRTNPAAEPWVRSEAASIASRTGLVVHDAKASVELRPPIDADKGTVAVALAEGFEAVLYVGDDVGDLPALRAVSGLSEVGSGRTGITAVVDGPELPAELRSVADLVLPGIEAPGGVVDLLRRLAEP